jgi:hypothetical protein
MLKPKMLVHLVCVFALLGCTLGTGSMSLRATMPAEDPGGGGGGSSMPLEDGPSSTSKSNKLANISTAIATNSENSNVIGSASESQSPPSSSVSMVSTNPAPLENRALSIKTSADPLSRILMPPEDPSNHTSVAPGVDGGQGLR